MASSTIKNPFVIGAIIVSALGLVALGSYARFSPANRVPAELKRQEAASRTTPPPKPTVTEPVDQKVTVLKPRMEGDDLKFDKHQETTPPKTDQKLFAVNQYLRTLQAVPRTAKALSCRVEGKIAYLNFNADIVSGYGTEDEMIVVEGILRTMGQFDDVDAVQFMVDGKNLDTLGSLDLSTPQKTMR